MQAWVKAIYLIAVETLTRLQLPGVGHGRVTLGLVVIVPSAVSIVWMS
jgi:hypothetical protein